LGNKSRHFRSDLQLSDVTVTGVQLSTIEVDNSSGANPDFTLTP
jgi:hypothetical protein